VKRILIRLPTNKISGGEGEGGKRGGGTRGGGVDIGTSISGFILPLLKVLSTSVLTSDKSK
jgi:hypothetical protein